MCRIEDEPSIHIPISVALTQRRDGNNALSEGGNIVDLNPFHNSKTYPKPIARLKELYGYASHPDGSLTVPLENFIQATGANESPFNYGHAPAYKSILDMLEAFWQMKVNGIPLGDTHTIYLRGSQIEIPLSRPTMNINDFRRADKRRKLDKVTQEYLSSAHSNELLSGLHGHNRDIHTLLEYLDDGPCLIRNTAKGKLRRERAWEIEPENIRRMNNWVQEERRWSSILGDALFRQLLEQGAALQNTRPNIEFIGRVGEEEYDQLAPFLEKTIFEVYKIKENHGKHIKPALQSEQVERDGETLRITITRMLYGIKTVPNSGAGFIIKGPIEEGLDLQQNTISRLEAVARVERLEKNKFIVRYSPEDIQKLTTESGTTSQLDPKDPRWQVKLAKYIRTAVLYENYDQPFNIGFMNSITEVYEASRQFSPGYSISPKDAAHISWCFTIAFLKDPITTFNLALSMRRRGINILPNLDLEKFGENIQQIIKLLINPKYKAYAEQARKLDCIPALLGANKKYIDLCASLNALDRGHDKPTNLPNPDWDNPYMAVALASCFSPVPVT